MDNTIGMRPILYLTMLLFSAAIGISFASQPSQFLAGQFLENYNISQSMINALTYTNITYSGHTYMLAYYKSQPTFLINTSASTYELVTDPNAISGVISSTIINNSLASINTTFLSSAIKAYNSTASSNLTDCYRETGLNNGNTCTIANYCQSCLTSPVCSAALIGSTRLHSAGLGYGSAFEYGIINFENNYTALNSDLSAYLSNVSSLSPSNLHSNLNNIADAFGRYSLVTQTIGNNPIFPPPQGADFAQCTGYGAAAGNVSSSGGPWYCNSVGLCSSLNYNYTLLSRLQGYINVLGSLPVTQQQVAKAAQNISASSLEYAGPVLNSQKKAQYEGVLSTTLHDYNATISGVTLLLSRLSNASFSGNVNALTANYTQLSTNYLSANISSLNKTLAREYSAVKSQYIELNATYSSLLNLSQANTRMLLEIQSQSPSGAAQLSFEQAQYNAQLSYRITNANALKSNLAALNSRISSSQPLPDVPASLSRAIDAPLASMLLSSAGYSQAIRMIPLYAIIPSVLIGAAFIVLVFLFHRSLSKHRRIVTSRRTKRNWRIVFGIAIGIVLMFTLATYLVASSANSSAPLSVAAGAIKSSGTVAVAVSGPSNPYIASCASKIRAALAHEGKSILNVSISGNTCTVGSSVQTTDSCMSSYASKNIPVIIISNSTHNAVTAYSYYGTVLSQSGTPQFTSECLAYLLVK